MTLKPFGRYIRDKRCAAGLTLRDVATVLGVSHVYLSEVERGERSVIAKERWPDLVRAIPDVTIEGLERASASTVPVQMDLTEASPAIQDLGLALARRIEQGGINDRQAREWLRYFMGDKK